MLFVLLSVKNYSSQLFCAVFKIMNLYICDQITKTVTTLTHIVLNVGIFVVFLGALKSSHCIKERPSLTKLNVFLHIFVICDAGLNVVH